MRKELFKSEAIRSSHPKWIICTSREIPLYPRNQDIRSQFARDYNRIIHSTAYRRLKHKTQVFPSPSNDHICTRIEHVNHVSSVSYTIAKFMGLNTELTDAIAVGHDLGHTPFGHAGESILKEIALEKFGDSFWHEMNSLHFIDKFETLEDTEGIHQNLSLTYAVRDGVVCHCGEVDENGIFPRFKKDDHPLEMLTSPNRYQPYTWEGCVVKIADKIAYLGRDIEDAISLKILDISQAKELIKIVRSYSQAKLRETNNTVLMHQFIVDLCTHSNPKDGIRISVEAYEMMKRLKDFNYGNIYFHDRLNTFKEYAKLVIKSIYNVLSGLYRGVDTVENLKRYREIYPNLTKFFAEWLIKYSLPEIRDNKKYQNKLVYNLINEKDYFRAIIDFISGMTDSFAIRAFNEIITF
jgi:dGTPase